MGIGMGLLAGIGLILLVWQIRRFRHNNLYTTKPPPSWETILIKNLPMIDKISETHKQQLFGSMHIFLSRISFEGCGGQEITEEIKVTIAAQACMLLLGRDARVYPKLKTVIVYPHTYQSGRKGLLGGDNGSSARLGESWSCGVVVLSWNSVLGGALNFEDGHNVTFHEFAHQLDQEDGSADGAPILESRSAYRTWAKVFNQEYKILVNRSRKGRKTTMDRYGATNPAEFFAVATETFFEKPRQPKTKHPELFEELQHYYKVNPSDWIEPH